MQTGDGRLVVPLLRSHLLAAGSVALHEVSIMADSQPDRTKEAAPDRLLLAQGPPSRASEFLIVGIGASASGLDACRPRIAGNLNNRDREPG